MLEVSLLGAGTVLRLERDAWSTVKGLSQATNEYAPPPPPRRLAHGANNVSLAYTFNPGVLRSGDIGERGLTARRTTAMQYMVTPPTHTIALRPRFKRRFRSLSLSLSTPRCQYPQKKSHPAMGVAVVELTNSVPDRPSTSSVEPSIGNDHFTSTMVGFRISA